MKRSPLLTLPLLLFGTLAHAVPPSVADDRLVIEWSRALAGRVLNDGGLSPQQQVERAYVLALSRAPNAREQKAVR